MTDIVDLTDQITALETTLGSTVGMVSAFEGELSKMQDSLVFAARDVGALTSGFSGGLRRAFDGVVFDGMKLTDALKGVAKSMSETVFNVAMKPVQGAVGGFLANGLNALLSKGMPFANGGAFAQGQVMPFAKGGVVSSPTSFGMRGGTGLMGGARGGHAADAGGGWAVGRPGGRRAGGDSRDEHFDPGRAGISAQSESDRCTGDAGLGARSAEQVKR